MLTAAAVYSHHRYLRRRQRTAIILLDNASDNMHEHI